MEMSLPESYTYPTLLLMVCFLTYRSTRSWGNCPLPLPPQMTLDVWIRLGSQDRVAIHVLMSRS